MYRFIRPKPVVRLTCAWAGGCLVGVAVVVVGRRRVGVGGASSGGIAHHGRGRWGAIVVGRRVGVVERPHPRPTIVLMHHTGGYSSSAQLSSLRLNRHTLLSHESNTTTVILRHDKSRLLASKEHSGILIQKIPITLFFQLLHVTENSRILPLGNSNSHTLNDHYFEILNRTFPNDWDSETFRRRGPEVEGSRQAFTPNRAD